MSGVTGNRERSSENKLQDAVKNVLEEKYTVGEAAIFYNLPYFKLHCEVQIKKFANDDGAKENTLRSEIEKTLGDILNVDTVSQRLGDDYKSILTQVIGYKYHDEMSKEVIQSREAIYIAKILKTLGESGCICKEQCAKDLMSYLATHLLREKKCTFRDSLAYIRQLIESRLCGPVMRKELSTSSNFKDKCIESELKDIYYKYTTVEKIFKTVLMKKQSCDCLKCFKMQNLPKEIYYYGWEKSRHLDGWDHEQKIAGPDYTEYFRKRYDIIFFDVASSMTTEVKFALRSMCRHEDNRQIIDAQESLSTEKSMKRSSDTAGFSDVEPSTSKGAKFDSTSQSSTSKQITDSIFKLSTEVQEFITSYLLDQKMETQQLFITSEMESELLLNIRDIIRSYSCSQPTSEQESTNVDEPMEDRIFTDEEEKHILKTATSVPKHLRPCLCESCWAERVQTAAIQYMRAKTGPFVPSESEIDIIILDWFDKFKSRHEKFISEIPFELVCTKNM